MSSQIKIAVSITLLASLAVGARADITPSAAVFSASPALGSSSFPPADTGASTGELRPSITPQAIVFSVAECHALSTGPAADASLPPTRQLPPGPGSTGLFLSAVGSLGAWHLSRSARRLHLLHVPDWYHTGGPTQIGHAFAFELAFNALPPCSYTRPGGEQPSLHGLCWETPPPLSECQCLLTTVTSRGPPPPATRRG